MTRHHIIGNELVLHRNVCTSEPIAIESTVILNDNSMDGATVYMLDWRIEKETAHLRYQLRNDAYASIYESSLPCRLVEIALEKPKGRGWSWDSFYGEWKRITSRKRERIRPV